MTVRRPLAHLVALLLGAGAALLVACGEGTRGGIPVAEAGDLKSQIEDVRQAAEDGRCSDVPGQLRHVDEAVDGLPPSTSDRLVRALRDGADTLRRRAVDECEEDEPDTQTTETTETTETEPAPAPPEPAPDEKKPDEKEPDEKKPDDEEPDDAQPPPPPEPPAPVPPPVPEPPGGGTPPVTPGGGTPGPQGNGPG